MHSYMYVYVCICMYMYVYIYIYIYTSLDPVHKMHGCEHDLDRLWIWSAMFESQNWSTCWKDGPGLRMAGSMFRKAGSKWTLQEVVSWKVGFGIWKAGSRLRKPGNCTGLVTSYLIGRLDPEIVRNCTNLVRNSLTGRLDLHEFGKELPYGKAWSGNCTKLYEFAKEFPYRKAGPARIW